MGHILTWYLALYQVLLVKRETEMNNAKIYNTNPCGFAGTAPCFDCQDCPGTPGTVRSVMWFDPVAGRRAIVEGAEAERLAEAAGLTCWPKP